MALHGHGRYGWRTREIPIALAIQFDVGRQSLDELRHDHVRHHDARDDGIGTRQVANKIQDELRPACHDDNACTDFPASNMLGDAGSNRRLLIEWVGAILGGGRCWHRGSRELTRVRNMGISSLSSHHDNTLAGGCPAEVWGGFSLNTRSRMPFTNWPELRLPYRREISIASLMATGPGTPPYTIS